MLTKKIAPPPSRAELFLMTEPPGEEYFDTAGVKKFVTSLATFEIAEGQAPKKKRAPAKRGAKALAAKALAAQAVAAKAVST